MCLSTIMGQLIEFLGLEKQEANYFRTLALYNQSQNPDEKELYFEQLVQLNEVAKKEHGEDYTEYYSHWYHSAVRSLLDCVDWRDDFGKLGNQLIPPLSKKEAEGSVELLQEMELIVQNDKGFWKPTDKAITSGAPSKQLNPDIKKYQLQTLEQAKLALMNNNVENYKSATLTMSAAKAAMQQIIKRTEQFRKEVFAIIGNDVRDPENVYQLNIQMVKQSRD